MFNIYDSSGAVAACGTNTLVATSAVPSIDVSFCAFGILTFKITSYTLANYDLYETTSTTLISATPYTLT